MIRVLTLDSIWTKCGICNQDIMLVDGGYSLPMYEGKVVNPDLHEWAGFPVCEVCYLLHLDEMYAKGSQ
jgi:hypothetical protein